jgi:hypothetical protein
MGWSCYHSGMEQPSLDINALPYPPRVRLRFRESFFLIAACLYAPFSWLLLIDYGWGDYRWQWLRLWPILPGFLPGAFFLHGNDTLEFTAWAATTFVLLFGLSWLGTRGTVGLAVALVVALAISVPSAYIAYALFRA